MATKKPTPKKKGKVKSIKPAHKAVKKAAPKKAATKKTKPAVKKTAKKPIPKKTLPKKVMPKKTSKPAVKKAVLKKPVAKPASQKLVTKPLDSKIETSKTVPSTKPIPHKPWVAAKTAEDVRPIVKRMVKKEPARPVKVVIPKTSTKSIKKYEPDFTKSVLDAHIQDTSVPSMRYSDADLSEFRELIQKKLDAAKKELNYLQGLITRKDESGDMEEARYMTMEDGSVSMEREQLSQMASRQIQFIDHLEKAMMRIENKTYGICRVTGKLIDKARLRAVPHATLSIEAKQMMNK